MPRYLDLDPAAGLPPRAARLDALIRAILRDPAWRRGEALGSVAMRAADRQMPAANLGLIREAVRRMDAWWDAPPFQALQERRTFFNSARFRIHDCVLIR